MTSAHPKFVHLGLLDGEPSPLARRPLRPLPPGHPVLQGTMLLQRAAFYRASELLEGA